MKIESAFDDYQQMVDADPKLVKVGCYSNLGPGDLASCRDVCLVT